jgi:hypothetical protein
LFALWQPGLRSSAPAWRDEEKNMETKAPFRMNDAARKAQERVAKLGKAHSETTFSGLYDNEYAPCAALKRLRDMNGVEVSMVAMAMDTLRIMQREARALMRVSGAVGPDRIVKRVMKKDQFTEFCMNHPA